MKKEERQNLISAYQNLASATPTIRKFADGERLARSISDEDYEVLEPFLLAEYERTYQIGEVQIRVEGRVSNYFTDVIDTEGRELLFLNDRHEAELFSALCEMIETVLSPVFDKTKSSLLYKCEEEEDDDDDE